MKYNILASKESIQKTMASLKERGHLPEFVESRVEALEKIKTLIPHGASVMNGSSRTLEEIGFVDYLREGKHGWNNLHATILAEKDHIKQAELRKQSVLSDFYLGSAHAVTETGEIVVASNSGSQLPHLVFTSPNLIFVVGLHPLEDERMKSVGMGGSYISKMLVINKEQPFMGRKSHVIFVNEKLGF